MQKHYGVPPPPTEEYHEAINYLHTIFKDMQTQSYGLELLAQSNAVLTRSNSAVMSQLAHINVITNAM